jgi:hypothetical protein
MECPFCVETIKDEAIACKHCARDLRVVRPVLLEVERLAAELDDLRQQLDRAGLKLERIAHPLRYFGIRFVLYVAIPSVLLVIAHVLVTIVFDVPPVWLRIASVVIPLLFGLATYPVHRAGFGDAAILGFSTASLSVLSMLTVTGLHDHVPILPTVWIEWREVIEYGASIFLAFVSGNILGIMAFRVLPKTLTQSGKPNAAAFKIALLLGPHVGEDQLRRRARLIQDLIQTAGPLAGVAATGLGSLYTGLKGVIGG